MKTKIFLLALLAAVLLAGCKSDDDSTPAQPEPRVQVMTVFAPGQLGDMGYADRVMKGVSTLKGSDADNVEVGIIAADSVAAIRQMLKDWAATKQSTADGAAYSRRLLVLTEPYMVDWLAEAKSQLTTTDEVLLLKANHDDAEAAAQQLGLTGRVYAINISAASSVRRFVEARKQFYAWKGVEPDTIDVQLLRLISPDVVAYRDSISETLTDLSAEHKAPDMYSLIEKPGEQYSAEYEVTSFEAAYHVCGIFYGLAYMAEQESETKGITKVFAISDLGSANYGAELFLVSANQQVMVLMLMLDSESNTDMMRFSIVRHFDRALTDWMHHWLRQPAGTMPRHELHGGWDGYCTDDIDMNVIRQI